jgi:hypothetical protein
MAKMITLRESGLWRMPARGENVTSKEKGVHKCLM